MPWVRHARALLRQGLPLAVIAVALLTYYPVATLGFVSDDFAQMLLAREGGWVSLWRPDPRLLHYSPLATAYRKVLVAIAEQAPGAWNSLALLQFVAALTVGLGVLRQFGLRRSEAGAAVLMWATFIYGYETIAWPTVTVYQPALLLYLLALYCHAREETRARWKSVVCFALSAMFLEAALVFVPAIVVLDAHRHGIAWLRGRLGRYLPALLVTTALLALRLAGDPGLGGLHQVRAMKRALVGSLYLSTFNQVWLLEAIFSEHWLRLACLAAVLMGALWLTFWAGAKVRVLFLMVLLHYAPFAAMAAVRPRYFSFCALFAVALWSLALNAMARRGTRALPWPTCARILTLSVAVAWVMASGLIFVRGRLSEWRRSGTVVARAGLALKPWLVAGHRILIVADLPAMSAREDDVFPPAYAFLSAFNACAWPRRLYPGGALPDVWLVDTRSDGDWPTVSQAGVQLESLSAWACEENLGVLRFEADSAELRAVPCAPSHQPRALSVATVASPLSCSSPAP